MKYDKIVAISLVLVFVVVIGEVVVYGMGSDRYSSDASYDSGTIGYSLSATGSKEYSVAIMNGGLDPIDELYIYYDESHATVYENPSIALGGMPLTQSYYIGQLTNSLNVRGFTNVTMLNADELEERMLDDISTTFSKGLVVIAGSLPDTVYQGNASDTIFNWLQDGGRLYWAGNLLGAFYSTTDDIIDVPTGYQTLFFGSECLNTGDTDTALSGIDNGYRSAFSIINNKVMFGVNTSMLVSTAHLAIGYTEEGYGSIVMTEFGNGMICVLGGDYSNNQRTDMAQVIASNICYSSTILKVEEGIASGNTGSQIDIGSVTGNISVYVYFGGFFTVYGKLHSFVA
jgi:hypothetical protein